MYPNVNNLIVSSNAETWETIGLVLGIIGAVLTYFLFLRKENENKYTGFVKNLYDFLSFKYMSLEFFIKILYMFAAIFITVYSFSLISYNFLAFLVYLIVGNVAARLIAEFCLLLLMIYKKITEIRDSVHNKK